MPSRVRNIVDMAATILHELGVEVPDDLEGPPLQMPITTGQ
jgi:hypothetical protein